MYPQVFFSFVRLFSSIWISFHFWAKYFFIFFFLLVVSMTRIMFSFSVIETWSCVDVMIGTSLQQKSLVSSLFLLKKLYSTSLWKSRFLQLFNWIFIGFVRNFKKIFLEKKNDQHFFLIAFTWEILRYRMDMFDKLKWKIEMFPYRIILH